MPDILNIGARPTPGRSHWRGEPIQFDFSDVALVGSEIRGETTSINS